MKIKQNQVTKTSSRKDAVYYYFSPKKDFITG